MKMIKKLTLIILSVFFALNVFLSPDLISSDRDNAVIISARALMNFENPYNHKTEIGQQITTGIFNALISIPFVYLFGDIQLLTFLFYLTFLILSYKSRYFYFIAALILLASPLLYRVMYYRLDELYWIAFYFAGLLYFKSKWRYLLLIPLMFSRNIFNFDFRALLNTLDYWLLIFAVYNVILFKIFYKKIRTRTE